jgi:hypothetical protein
MTPTDKDPTMDPHDQKRILIETALSKLQDARDLDERHSLQVEKWTAWYDATIPLVTDIKVIAGAMEVELAKRRGMRLEAEPETRGRPSSQEIVSSVDTISNAARLVRKRDRALGRQPAAVDAYVQSEAKAGRVPTRHGALRHVQRIARPKTVKAASKPGWSGGRSEDHYQRILVGLEKAADGQPRSDRELQRLVGCAPDDFIRFVRFIPWATMTRTHAPTSTMFTIDQELRDICEGRVPRPILEGRSIQDFLRHLRAEIIRRRKENHDAKRQVGWNSYNIMTREQTDLLNWIETELDRVPA